MNRSLWTRTLNSSLSPEWPCPACNKGSLGLVPKSLTFKETIGSRQERGEDYWSPELVSYVFTAWLKCRQPACGQEVAVAGTGGVEQWQTADEDGQPDIVYDDYFSPKAFSPMPDIFEIPPKCPENVQHHIRASFRLFFSDEGAAANRIRVALENLLDYVAIPRQRKENGKVWDLKLHKRIEAFETSQPTLGGQLMALKWLGNTASHEGGISRDDLLDAFEILEHALNELVGQRSARIAELARKLAKKHAKP